MEVYQVTVFVNAFQASLGVVWMYQSRFIYNVLFNGDLAFRGKHPERNKLGSVWNQVFQPPKHALTLKKMENISPLVQR
jgi:hypothetical protein